MNKNKLTTDDVWIIYPNNVCIDELFLDITQNKMEIYIKLLNLVRQLIYY